MRLTTLASLLVLSGLAATGLSAAASDREEAMTLDLSMLPGGMTLFVKCSRGTDIANCGVMSLWEQTNDHPGLQTSLFAYGTPPRAVDPDFPLLP